MNNKYKELIKKLGKEKVGLNEPLSVHTTFIIGGPADLFYEAKDEKGRLQKPSSLIIFWIKFESGLKILPR